MKQMAQMETHVSAMHCVTSEGFLFYAFLLIAPSEVCNAAIDEPACIRRAISDTIDVTYGISDHSAHACFLPCDLACRQALPTVLLVGF